MTRRTSYRVAGECLLVETGDAPAAAAVEALFAGWYLDAVPDGGWDAAPAALAFRSRGNPPPVPDTTSRFDVVAGSCHAGRDGACITVGGSMVAFGGSDGAPVDAWLDGPPPTHSEELTRVVTYALSAALRRRGRYELHCAAFAQAGTGKSALVVGPSGSGKSTLAVHLASAGWPVFTDDVALLGLVAEEVRVWPLRRRFAITATTFASSPFLQARTSLDDLDLQDEKRLFLPHEVFTPPSGEPPPPATLLFTTLTGERRTRVEPVATGESMARLIRMSPWCCYDRETAPGHLQVLGVLATQCTAYALRCGTDLLDPVAALEVVSACLDARGAHA